MPSFMTNMRLHLSIPCTAGSMTRATESGLDQDIAIYKSMTFAESTKRTYKSQLTAYLSFCHAMGYRAVPASSATLHRYAALLARSLKFTSIKQYISVIRFLHLEWGLPDPLKENYSLTALMKGIQRSLSSPIRRKAPITPPLLLHILSRLDLSKALDSCVWAAALVMFHAMLRRSNVLPSGPTSFDQTKQLRLMDITVFRDHLSVYIKWSKTMQFGERPYSIPLYRARNSPLCPVQATVHARRFSQGAPLDGPAFVYLHQSKLKPLTSGTFMQVIRQCLASSGFEKSQFGTHSFRRGGASHAFQAGLSVDSIRLIGDWKSNAYTSYVFHSNSTLHSAMKQIGHSLPTYT